VRQPARLGCCGTAQVVRVKDIACDEDMSLDKQLMRPVLHAIGRRAVQRYLT
jgi:hypothetical protein